MDRPLILWLRYHDGCEYLQVLTCQNSGRKKNEVKLKPSLGLVTVHKPATYLTWRIPCPWVPYKLGLVAGVMPFDHAVCDCFAMDLLPDTQICGLRMRRECRERFPRHRLQRKLLVSDPSIHHGMCVTHVPWCMSGSLIRDDRKTFPEFPAHAQAANLRIW